MKILHTSDWHLGHSLYNNDCTDEQQHMLSRMAEIVKDHKPDLFLLCGDVYDTGQPSNAVQTMLTEALVKIHDACPTMTIVMTAGNHDSGSKHEIFRTPWEALHVYAIGTLRKLHSQSGRHVGIISHIEELRESIPTQIQVIQSAQTGSSRIDIFPK